MNTEDLFQKFIADNFEGHEFTPDEENFVRLIFSAGAVMTTLLPADQIHNEFRDLAALLKTRRNLSN